MVVKNNNSTHLRMWFFAGMCNGVTLVTTLHLFARDWRWLVPGGDLILMIICVALTLWSWIRWKYQDMAELTVDPQVSKPQEAHKLDTQSSD